MFPTYQPTDSLTLHPTNPPSKMQTIQFDYIGNIHECMMVAAGWLVGWLLAWLVGW
jgi:hypothetical protein